MPEFAHKVVSLRSLLRKDRNRSWIIEHQKFLSDLKQLGLQAPLLAFYIAEAKTIVSADASSYGMGAALLQIKSDGRKAQVMYASRTLTDQESVFHKYKKQQWLNLVWDVTDLYHFCWVEMNHLLIETIINL